MPKLRCQFASVSPNIATHQGQHPSFACFREALAFGAAGFSTGSIAKIFLLNVVTGIALRIVVMHLLFD